MRAHAALVVLVAGAGVAASLASVSCVDETHNEEVAALGPEVGSPGPEHRPGQPCITCHGGSGPAHLQLSVGGTVYQYQGGGGGGVEGATVQVEDVDGHIHTATTNSAGNFYIALSDFAPHYPTQMTVTSPDGSTSIQMLTHVGRDGSCADCHTPTAGPNSAGPVYISTPPRDGG